MDEFQPPYIGPPPPPNAGSPFRAPSERRLRAGWRITITLLLVFVVEIFTGFVFSVLAALMLLDPFAGIGLLLLTLVTALLVTPVIWLARTAFDRRSLVSLGLRMNRRALPDLFFGFLLGGVLIGIIYLTLRAGGWLQVTGTAWQFMPAAQVVALTLVSLVSIGLLTGWTEELIFRGYLLQNLAEGINVIWAVLISSLLFGLFHLANPHFSLTGFIGIILAGVMMAMGWLRTRQLWLPIGLHAGWNFFESTVFGFPVSGMNIFSLQSVTVTGPTLLTGGAFGPEAGLLTYPVLLLGILLIHLWGRQRAYTAQ